MTRQANIEILPVGLKQPMSSSFYVNWIVLTSLCVPAAYFIGIIILKIITNIVGDYISVNGIRHITEDYLAMYVLVPSIGLLTGLIQYGLLRRYLAHMGWWILVTVAGWYLGVLLIALPSWLGWSDAPLNNLDFVFLLMGLGIGAVQWLLLQRRFPQAGWWVAANVVGWGGLALITPNNTLNQFGFLILGFLPACATAVTLAFLVNKVTLAEPKL